MLLRQLLKGGYVGFLLWSSAALATPHALIMSIGDYRAGVTPLPGVRYDMENARKIARKLGVMDANILQLHDGELTLAGMRQAFERFIAGVGANDEVFIYYSGHGGREYVREAEERCAESLITVDGEHFTDAELSARLQSLTEKASRIIVLLDAGHSGGATMGSVQGEPKARFTAKYWSKGQADACDTPSNVIVSKLSETSRSLGRGVQNYVYISAARDDEASLDEPGKGGLVTQAWAKCMLGGASDTDGSGAITAEEIRACAQQQIDKAVEGLEEFRPHHINVFGNPDAVLVMNDTKVEKAASSARLVNPYGTLMDIYNSRDDRRLVTLKAKKTALQIGKDRVEFTLTTTHPGYLYLLMVGSDGKAFDLLFPNTLDKGHYLEAGEILELPAPNWQITAQGPPGTDHLLAIVSDAPRNFSALGAKPAGPFSVVEASPRTIRSLQMITSASAHSVSTDCKDKPGSARKAESILKCSDAYGAAILNLDEFDEEAMKRGIRR